MIDAAIRMIQGNPGKVLKGRCIPDGKLIFKSMTKIVIERSKSRELLVAGSTGEIAILT